MYVSQRLDRFIARFSSAWNLATKVTKTFTKACSNISPHKRNEIRNEVFTPNGKCKGLENFSVLTLQPLIRLASRSNVSIHYLLVFSFGVSSFF